MKMYCKQSANLPTSKTERANPARISRLAMSALAISTLGIAPFSVSMVRADSKPTSKNGTQARAATPAGAKSTPKLASNVLEFRVDKTLALALPDDSKYSIVEGRDLVAAEVKNGLLVLKSLRAGSAVLVLQSTFQGTQCFVLKMTGDGTQVIPGDTVGAMVGVVEAPASPLNLPPAPKTGAEKVADQLAPTPILSLAQVPQIINPSASPLPVLKVFGGGSPLASGGLEAVIPFVEPPARGHESPLVDSAPLGIVPAAVDSEIDSKELTEQRIASLAMATTTAAAAQISPDVPMPSAAAGEVPAYPTESKIPVEIARAVNDPSVNRPKLSVSRGMARVLAFRQNILAVFFSDDNVMDARAVNARTVAVTGKGNGKSTLAIFLARTPDDVVGRAVVYNVDVYNPDTPLAQIGITDPAAAAEAIRNALADARVNVSVIESPSGARSLAYRESCATKPKWMPPMP